MKLSARAVFSNGIGATGPGLTISCLYENGQFHFQAGAAILADGGVWCIDEFGLIKKEDLVTIHEGMEQQTISASKGGTTIIAHTRTTIIAACNPILSGQKYDPEKNLCENTGLMDSVLSRFDLIFVMRDRATKKRDEEISSFILAKVEISNF
ncbi:unnamed protein product [Sphagnum balticum]